METLQEKRERLARMEAGFEAQGGRNVALAESIDELRAEIDEDEAGILTVRKLRRILNDLPPGLPVVLEGTEWDLYAGRAEVREDWQPQRESGERHGEPRRVLYIKLD